MITPKNRVLISAVPFGEFDQTTLNPLREAELEVVMATHGSREYDRGLETAVGIIAGTEPLGINELNRARFLKVISRCGIGLDNIDLQEVQRKGIALKNTPEAPTLAVAEFALALILSSLRNIAKADRAIRRGGWAPEKGELLDGKTVGIVGLGRVGRRLAELLEPFRVHLIAFEAAPQEEFVRRHQIVLVRTIDEVFQKSDIVTLHLPLTGDPTHRVGERLLRFMKPRALLINTARGALIDEKALLRALREEWIAGAALDTFDTEPYGGPLVECENVILTSHMASYARESRVRMEKEAVSNLLAELDGEKNLWKP